MLSSLRFGHKFVNGTDQDIKFIINGAPLENVDCYGLLCTKAVTSILPKTPSISKQCVLSMHMALNEMSCGIQFRSIHSPHYSTH